MVRRPLPILLVVVSLAVAGWWTMRAEPAPVPLSSPTAADPGDAGLITVHVAGAVVSPGVVQVSDGSRVVDAIAAAGGLTRDSRSDLVNLAAPLRDGDQIVVPDAAVEQASSGDGRIRVNVASVAELERLPGVGPVLAERIAAHRDVVGRFAEVEDLLDVPGIGEAKLASLRDHVAIP